MRIAALIPARFGSVRIPQKNIKPLAGHPLIAYTIAAAKQSGIFAGVWVSTENAEVVNVAMRYDCPSIWRSQAAATNESPDIDWLMEILNGPMWGDVEAIAILRPTSPFRTAATIQRAWEKFSNSTYHSLRAVEPVKQHPAKMWVLDTSVYGGLITPLIGDRLNGHPMHSCPTQILPQVYTQNASLEMALVSAVRETKTISGEIIGPFFTEGYEGFDLNTLDDWAYAEAQIASGQWTLPPV
jgi:N-acylneuraminate cytidylyltransferase